MSHHIINIENRYCETSTVANRNLLCYVCPQLTLEIKNMTAKISEDEIVQALELHASGKTMIQIGKILGRTPDLLSRRMRERGADTAKWHHFYPPSNRLDLDTDRIKTMYENGISENIISKTMGV